ncbi:MAG TPA: hypothetical protein VFD82_06915 [Planctomycetota bacterium]|nr:hypothetical protein [Planctomycetota bacterium]
MRALPLLVLGGVLAAQARAPQTQAPTPAVTRAQQRATDDVQEACRKFLLEPHAFTGTCTFHTGREDTDTTVAYRGAWHDRVALFEMDEHSVLTNGERQLVRVRNRAWTLPQGDAPDCPLEPRVLAAHLPHATIKSCEATSHADRPAMRVHAVWTGVQAGELAVKAAVPHGRYQALLENMPALQKRIPDRVVVDAAICFDPATKALLAATLRIALLDETELPADQAPTTAPVGLPPLTRVSLADVAFDFTVQQPAKVPMPELDGTLRTMLGLPPR